jgi:predicted outer membrane repeat protein
MDALFLSKRGVMSLAFSLFVTTEIVCAGTLYVDSSGVSPYRTIGAAVEASQSGDTIVIMPGTYRGADNTNITIEDKVLTICSSDPNDPDVAAATVIDCSATVAEFCRAFFVTSTESRANVTFAGLTMVNGIDAFEGGIVLGYEADLALINCTIYGSEVTWWGGGLYVEGGHAAVQGCAFRNNVSLNRKGGAISCKNSVMEITDCTFESNEGNAIYANGSSLALSNCSFRENSGDAGGAIYDFVSATLAFESYLTLTSCTFEKNSASLSGGALYAGYVPTTITRCVFTGNKATGGGAAIASDWTTSVVGNCLFIGNAAGGSGGAILNSHQGDAKVTNCTFTANSAASGGVIASELDSVTRISHCILWGNAASQGQNLSLGGHATGQACSCGITVEYSDVQNGRNSVAKLSGCTLTWGAGNIDADPLFLGPLQDEGDYHLSPDSPCIDAGNSAFIPAAGTVDLAGSSRRYGVAADMGAYEYQGTGPVYRFWSESTGTHFYTISAGERDKLINKYSHIWTWEGIAYYAYYRPTETNLSPVYRFWSPTLGCHFWTVSEAEKNKLRTQMADAWQYEGVVFYAYAAGKQPFDAVPVYRFLSNASGSHFYTVKENEKNKLLTQGAKAWTYEGIGWYAFTGESRLDTAAYTFTGGSQTASYTLTLEAYIDADKAEIDKPLVQLVTQRTSAQMTIDFVSLQTTLDELHVQSATTSHTATISRSGLSIPLSLTVRASFDALCPRGPFDIDPSNGWFANYLSAARTYSAADDTFAYAGTATVAGRATDFNFSGDALLFELSSVGSLESLTLLPEGLYAEMPRTFQWQRPYIQDLLADISVNGHRVRLFVTNMYVGTLSVWEGQAAE